MGRGGAGGSSGRSFSGGSGRSFGGHSSSGSSRGSSISRSSTTHRNSSPRPSYSSPKPTRPSTPPSRPVTPPPRRVAPPPRPVTPPPIIINTCNHHNDRPVYTSQPSTYNHYEEPKYSRKDQEPNKSSLVPLVITGIFIIMMLFILLPLTKNLNVEKSTVVREAIQPLEPFNKDCIDDELDWITTKSKVLTGMETFYKETGVQPLLVITDNIDGNDNPSNAEIEAYCNTKYDTFMDENEGGILLLFCEWSESEYSTYYLAGESAQTVMDSEASEVMLDFADALYTSDLSDEEYFSEIFAQTADRIMTVTPTFASKLPAILIAFVIMVALIVGYNAYIKKIQRDKEKAEETERILNTPLEKL